MNQTEKITLASKSPRRAQLLKQIGLVFTVAVADVDESQVRGEDSARLAMDLSRMKAETVRNRVESGLIIGADTIVVLHNERLGKPVDEADAFRMLSTLSGKTHQVYTGFTLLQIDGREFTGFACTDVTFRALQPWEITAYINTGSPMDKAGSYGIQDVSSLFVQGINGCFYNVVGFPLQAFYEALHVVWGPEKVKQTFL